MCALGEKDVDAVTHGRVNLDDLSITLKLLDTDIPLRNCFVFSGGALTPRRHPSDRSRLRPAARGCPLLLTRSALAVI